MSAGHLSPTPLRALVALLLCALAAVAWVRLSGMDIRQQADAPAVALRTLRFADTADGSLQVIDDRSGRVLETVEPGHGGFIRSTLRGLVRERKRQSLGDQLPFELIGRADGRLTLVDPATQRRIDLEAFGSANAATFARLL
ncbi:putative photosynthetic complex assembly protein [Pseudacidovorax sp. RU35E]|uniref:photosynthetic complex assembly protein PuhC n=1 Tax=uncultured Pseudacidovorax sp. TaxID=679313 RepID=UPI0009545488|nr:photosynthetic complex assembly protein PuhC [uncultured Pseudacidovorax sp.]SIR60096.1 putative photosynthetic complex assembly protein [Pseudacidovorax sp. RU35E]